MQLQCGRAAGELAAAGRAVPAGAPRHGHGHHHGLLLPLRLRGREDLRGRARGGGAARHLLDLRRHHAGRGGLLLGRGAGDEAGAAGGDAGGGGQGGGAVTQFTQPPLSCHPPQGVAS